MNRACLIFVVGLLLVAVGCGGGQGEAEEPGRVVVSDTDIEILGDVVFEPDSDVIERGADTLRAVADTLKGNPDIEVLALETLSSSVELSRRRCGVAGQAMCDAGVAPDRLRCAPLVGTDAMEFVIVRRSGEQENSYELKMEPLACE